MESTARDASQDVQAPGQREAARPARVVRRVSRGGTWKMNDFEYPSTSRVSYEGGATFVPVCTKCGRYVKADATIWVGDAGLKPGPNATCSKCGRAEMLFEGFV